VYVTLQVPEARVQLVALKTPVEFVVKLTVPVGVPLLEVTVAVHVVATLLSVLAGEQETAVVVAKMVWETARVNVPLLPVWTLSPP
jgi:hypothetical protein